MRIYLDVPYEEKDYAKASGARWDAVKRQWYVIDPPELALFARWLPKDVKAFLGKYSSKKGSVARTRLAEVSRAKR